MRGAGAAPARGFRPASDGPDAPPRVGIVRNLPNAYDVDALGAIVPSNPSAAWAKVEPVRSSQPVFRLAPPVVVYDPTAGPPEYWTP